MKAQAIDRPFDAAVLARARKAVEQYQVVIWFEDGQYWGRCMEADCLGDGATPSQCMEHTRQAATVAVAYLIEQGQEPPLPARAGARTEQVNVRLTVEERTAIESAANRLGFRGVSDYMRTKALT